MNGDQCVCVRVCVYVYRRCTQNVVSHLAFMRYSARLMLAGGPVMVTRRSFDPSTGFAILIWAPDICLISLIFAPWRPMMHPISCVWREERPVEKRELHILEGSLKR